MIRIFRREPDHQADTVEIEADTITKPKKTRRTGDHNAMQVDADGRAVITVTKQFPGKNEGISRPPKGTRLTEDGFTVEARKFTRKNPRGKREVCVAGKRVDIYRRPKA